MNKMHLKKGYTCRFFMRVQNYLLLKGRGGGWVTNKRRVVVKGYTFVYIYGTGSLKKTSLY